MYKNKKICVLVPAFNEEQSIKAVLARMPQEIDSVYVIDDGSSDDTARVAREAGAAVLSHDRNRGLGVAFKTGIEQAIATDADIVVNIDADGQFDPQDILPLIDPVADGRAGFATASRFIDCKLYPKMPLIKFYGNRFMSYMVSKITGRKFYDVSCGFRAYSRDTLYRMTLFGQYTYTQETFIDLAYKGIRIAEVPTRVDVRKYGNSKVASNLIKYGYNTAKIILRAARDHKAFKVFGYLSLLSMLIGSAFMTFFLIHYFVTGYMDRHKWSAFVAAFFAMLSILIFMLGFLADMLARIRYIEEEILTHLKKKNGP